MYQLGGEESTYLEATHYKAKLSKLLTGFIQDKRAARSRPGGVWSTSTHKILAYKRGYCDLRISEQSSVN
jgi:hypothetical protein